MFWSAISPCTFTKHVLKCHRNMYLYKTSSEVSSHHVHLQNMVLSTISPCKFTKHVFKCHLTTYIYKTWFDVPSHHVHLQNTVWSAISPCTFTEHGLKCHLTMYIYTTCFEMSSPTGRHGSHGLCTSRWSLLLLLTVSLAHNSGQQQVERRISTTVTKQRVNWYTFVSSMSLVFRLLIFH
jgi:hypothetical protein